jgi:hypothetical protein
MIEIDPHPEEKHISGAELPLGTEQGQARSLLVNQNLLQKGTDYCEPAGSLDCSERTR